MARPQCILLPRGRRQTDDLSAKIRQKRLPERIKLSSHVVSNRKKSNCCPVTPNDISYRLILSGTVLEDHMINNVFGLGGQD
jgi:hypothetical protein